MRPAKIWAFPSVIPTGTLNNDLTYHTKPITFNTGRMFITKPRVKKDVPLPPSKKRKVFHAVEEVNFDFDARSDYLTGFRKRKLERIKKAQEIAAEKERQERIKLRKQVRLLYSYRLRQLY